MNRKEKSLSEEILGIFPGWIQDKSSRWIMKGWTCKLVFTNNRLIIADMKHRTGEPQIVGDPDYIFSSVSVRDRLKMKEVSAESMLKENTENFEIQYSDIAAVELKSILLKGSRNLLIFITENLDVPKYTITVKMRSRHLEDFVTFLRTVLPNKI